MRVVYDDENLSVTIEGLDEVERALGALKAKTPAATKAAINATAREAKKVLVKAAKARYAVNAAGARHLNDLSTKRGKGHSATLARLEAVLYDAKLKSDLGYFQHRPTQTFTSWRVLTDAPEVVRARVLKSSGMKPLEKTAGLSKGFLIKFNSGHVGMVRRKIGVDAEQGRGAARVSPRRWRNRDGIVEQLSTMGAPSAVTMHGKVWPEKEPEIGQYLLDSMEEQMQRIMQKYSGR